MYEAEAPEEELDAFGFKPSDYDDDDFGVWPDNWEAVQLFSGLSTQWRHAGMAGVAVGLDYTAVRAVFDMQAIKRKHWPELLDRIRVLEAEALSVMRENKD